MTIVNKRFGAAHGGHHKIMDRFTFSGITNRLIGNLLHKPGGSMFFIKLKQSFFSE